MWGLVLLVCLALFGFLWCLFVGFVWLSGVVWFFCCPSVGLSGVFGSLMVFWFFWCPFVDLSGVVFGFSGVFLLTCLVCLVVW